MNVPNLTPVNSKAFKAYGFDAARNALFIQYHGGDVWQYEGCSMSLFQQFEAADSMGSFLARSIKPNTIGTKVSNNS